MIIGERLRRLLEQKKLPQREIGNRSGLQRAYLSRVENGHTVPTIETLERWAKVLEMRVVIGKTKKLSRIEIGLAAGVQRYPPAFDGAMVGLFEEYQTAKTSEN